MLRIFWDTNLFIYLLEDYGAHSEKVINLLDGVKRRRAQIYTSTMTLGELLIGPLKAGRTDLVSKYETTLSPPGVVVIPFDRGCARTYAHVRQEKGIHRADAIQLACAAQIGCDLFVTNDERLSRAIVPGIHFIVPLSGAFL